jgi:hypothetical protein
MQCTDGAAESQTRSGIFPPPAQFLHQHLMIETRLAVERHRTPPASASGAGDEVTWLPTTDANYVARRSELDASIHPTTSRTIACTTMWESSDES